MTEARGVRFHLTADIITDVPLPTDPDARERLRRMIRNYIERELSSAGVDVIVTSVVASVPSVGLTLAEGAAPPVPAIDPFPASHKMEILMSDFQVLSSSPTAAGDVLVLVVQDHGTDVDVHLVVRAVERPNGTWLFDPTCPIEPLSITETDATDAILALAVEVQRRRAVAESDA